MMKVTQWFSCKTPPVHAGEYEFRLAGTESHGSRAYFTGIRFSCMTNALVADRNFLLNTRRKDYEWRGLADKPKGKA